MNTLQATVIQPTLVVSGPLHGKMVTGRPALGDHRLVSCLLDVPFDPELAVVVGFWSPADAIIASASYVEAVWAAFCWMATALV